MRHDPVKTGYEPPTQREEFPVVKEGPPPDGPSAGQIGTTPGREKPAPRDGAEQGY